MYKNIKYIVYLSFIISLLCSCRNSSSDNIEKIDFVLDWTPNTNHTGLYVAEKLGYFEEEGIKISINQPSEDGATAIVASGRAQFGIDFQDSLASAFSLDEPMPVIAVAAILQHNTSGIISLKENGIVKPSDLESKKYSLWNGPLEIPILKHIVEIDGGDFENVEIIPNTASDVISALNSNVDAMWIYYNWDGIATEVKGFETNFFRFKDIDPILDYYTPVIIANNDYIKGHPDITRRFLRAVEKGYKYCIDNPYESAQILLETVPELDRDITFKSQVWTSKQYKAESDKWGYINPKRWNDFYKWVYDNLLIENKIEDDFGFTNEYLP